MRHDKEIVFGASIESSSAGSSDMEKHSMDSGFFEHGTIKSDRSLSAESVGKKVPRHFASSTVMKAQAEDVSFGDSASSSSDLKTDEDDQEHLIAKSPTSKMKKKSNKSKSKLSQKNHQQAFDSMRNIFKSNTMLDEIPA